MGTLYQSITPVGVIMGLGIGSRCELHGQPTNARSILRLWRPASSPRRTWILLGQAGLETSWQADCRLPRQRTS